MKHFVAALGFVTLLLPFAASANSVMDARYSTSATHAEVLFVSSEPLGEPRIDTSEGLVRLWFPEVRDSANVTREGDASIRWIRVRPGAAGAALVKLELGDNRVLDRSQIEVTRDEAGTHVRIAKASLPVAAAAPVAATAAAPAVATATAAAPAAATAAIPATAPASAATATVPAAAPATAPASAAAPTVQRSMPVTKRPAAHARARKVHAKPLPAGNNSAIFVLALLTLVLAGVYFLLKAFLAKRKAVARPSDIQILASKRLGPRHQLLLIRALGEDHLLAVHGGQTQHITSVPSPAETSDDDVPNQAAGLLEQNAPSLNFDAIRERTGLFRKRENKREEIKPAVEDDASMFGAELHRLAVSRRYGESKKTPSVASSTGNTSESVAGLIRLRERVGSKS